MSADFLKLDPASESAGFGSAYVARPATALGSYFNPAGLARLRRSEALYSQTDLFAGINYRYLSVAHPVESFDVEGSLGLDVTSLDFGSQQRTRITNNDPITGLGSFEAEDMALSAAYGATLRDNLDVGLSLKYVESTIAGFSDETITGNLGLQYHPPVDGLILGVAGRNMIGDLSLNQRADPLPQQVEGGAYYQLALDGHGRHVLHLGAGVTATTDNGEFTTLGLEYEYYQRGFLRVGHKSLQDADDDGFTFGVGLHYRNIKIDYAFVPFGNLGDLQRVSFAYQFGAPHPRPGSEAERLPDPQQADPEPERTSSPQEKTETPSEPPADSRRVPSVRRAVQHYNQGNLTRAQDQLETILRQRPNHVNALLWLGKIDYEQGEIRSAIKRFQRVLQQDPDNPMARRNLRTIQQHHPELSNPSSTSTPWRKHLNRGRSLYKQQNYERALDHLEKAHNQHSDSIEVLLWLGKTEHNLGRNQQARERMLQILKLNPDHQPAFSNFLNWD